MSDTIRTLSELQTTYLADNVAGDITPQDMRDFLVSVYGGGLTPNAQPVTTEDVTGAVGQLYVCTIAELTANRNITLPSAAPGERMGVYIVDGHDTFSLILLGATSQTINGGSAATEWSRVFIKGECVIFLCVAANTWIVESDKRIPCEATMFRTAVITGLTNATDVEIANYNTMSRNIGNCGNATTGRVTARRANSCAISGKTRIVYQSTGNVSDGSIAIVLSKINGANDVGRHDNYSIVGAVGSPIITLSHIQTLGIGDYISLFGFLNYAGGSGSYQLGVSDWNMPRFQFTEILGA